MPHFGPQKVKVVRWELNCEYNLNACSHVSRGWWTVCSKSNLNAGLTFVSGSKPTSNSKVLGCAHGGGGGEGGCRHLHCARALRTCRMFFSPRKKPKRKVTAFWWSHSHDEQSGQRRCGGKVPLRHLGKRYNSLPSSHLRTTDIQDKEWLRRSWKALVRPPGEFRLPH